METYIFKGLNLIALLLSFRGLTTTSCIMATRAGRSPMSRLTIALASPDGRSRRKSHYDMKNNIVLQPIGVNPHSSIRTPHLADWTWIPLSHWQPWASHCAAAAWTHNTWDEWSWSSLYCHVIDMRAFWCSLEGYKLCEKKNKKSPKDSLWGNLNGSEPIQCCCYQAHALLSWASILKAVTVADFNLLCDTQSDIQFLPWTEPSCQEATGLYFGIKHAHEEVTWLNIKIKHLLTFMLDMHIDYYCAICVNIIVDWTVAQQLSIKWEYHYLAGLV